MNPPENWFCCLALPEEGVWDYLARALPATLYLGVPVALVDAARILYGLTEEWRYASFLRIYHLAHGSVMDGELPIDVVLPEDGYLDVWVSNSVWLLLTEPTCSDGCPLSPSPTP